MTTALDFRPIFLVSGILLSLLGAAMLIPALVDIASQNEDWKVFSVSAVITGLTGASFFAATRGVPKGLSTRQALLMTVVSWIFLAAFGALPFLAAGVVPTYTDAFFESMSGLTTTGATVIDDLESVPPGILFWRGILQWLGGLGIIVMAVAVLPMLQIGGMQIFKVEAFETPEKILPRATQISGSITLIFITITFICSASYLIAGMEAGEAMIHAMTTVATGGFSTRDASIGGFENPAIDMVAIVFMILGSIPFLLYVQLLQGRAGALWSDSQVRTFLGILAVATFVAFLFALYASTDHPLDSLLYATFNVVSIMTGTGYATTDYEVWGGQATALFFVLMFVGGCAGSTSCGIKIFRFQVLFEDVKQHLAQVVHPHRVYTKRFNGRPIDDQVTIAVMTFFFLYVAAFTVLAVLLRLTGLDFTTAMSGAASSISNVGPGLGQLIGPTGTYEPLNDTAKWMLSAGMLIGRLELLTVLVLFLPRFWRS